MTYTDAKSPRFEDVIGGGAFQEAPSGAGKSPNKEEKEEEKNPDVHFKQKRKDSPPHNSDKKQVAKKDHWHARDFYYWEMSKLHASLPWSLDYWAIFLGKDSRITISGF